MKVAIKYIYIYIVITLSKNRRPPWIPGDTRGRKKAVKLIYPKANEHRISGDTRGEQKEVKPIYPKANEHRKPCEVFFSLFGRYIIYFKANEIV